MTNAVLNKFNSATATPTRQAPPPDYLEHTYNQPAYGGPTYPPPDDTKRYGGGSGGRGPAAPTRYMTIDDVIVRTGAMLARCCSPPERSPGR